MLQKKSFATILASSQKKNDILMYFSPQDLSSLDNFVSKVLSLDKISVNNTYTVFIKIRYSKDNFFMGGSPFGFPYKSIDDLTELYNILSVRLDDSFSMYNIEDNEIVYIQLSFKSIDYKSYSDLVIKDKISDTLLDDKKKFSVSDKKPNFYTVLNHHTNTNIVVNDSLSKKEASDYNSIASLPFNLSDDYLNYPLLVILDDKGIITNIKLNINNKDINFLDLIKKRNVLNKNIYFNSFTSDFKFYFVNSKHSYILGIKQIDENLNLKLKYSLSGVLHTALKESINDNIISRQSGNKEIIINNGSLVKLSESISFKPLKEYYYKLDDAILYPNIGVIDLEIC